MFGDIAKGVELPSGVELTIQIIPTGTTCASKASTRWKRMASTR